MCKYRFAFDINAGMKPEIGKKKIIHLKDDVKRDEQNQNAIYFGKPQRFPKPQRFQTSYRSVYMYTNNCLKNLCSKTSAPNILSSSLYVYTKP